MGDEVEIDLKTIRKRLGGDDTSIIHFDDKDYDVRLPTKSADCINRTTPQDKSLESNNGFCDDDTTDIHHKDDCKGPDHDPESWAGVNVKGWYPKGHKNALTDDNYGRYRDDLVDLETELNAIDQSAVVSNANRFGLRIQIPKGEADVVHDLKSPRSDTNESPVLTSEEYNGVYKNIIEELKELKNMNGYLKKEPVGFYILGGHLTRLKLSMDQRIEHAIDLAQSEEHKKQPPIYFVSGYKKGGAMSEAEYMAEKILKTYDDRGLPKPVIVMDNEARFTVMNFLKTLPLINKLRAQLEFRLEKVYLITSDYHIPRSEAILDEFVKNGLTNGATFVPSGAEHPQKGKKGRDVWLDGPAADGSGGTEIEAILDPRRDRSNANCFATMCRIITTQGSYVEEFAAYKTAKRGRCKSLECKYSEECLSDDGNHPVGKHCICLKSWDVEMMRLYTLSSEELMQSHVKAERSIKQYQANNIPGCHLRKQYLLKEHAKLKVKQGCRDLMYCSYFSKMPAVVGEVEELNDMLAKEKQLIQFGDDFVKANKTQ